MNPSSMQNEGSIPPYPGTTMANDPSQQPPTTDGRWRKFSNSQQ